MTTSDMEESTMPTRWERVKQHVIRNRYWYAAGGLALVAGALGYSVGRASVDGSTHWEIEGVSAGEDVVIGGDHIENNEVHIHNTNNYGGYQSKIVKNLDTGEIFESQKAAAESVGVSEKTMSRHLNGSIDHLDGVVFERIGLGTL